MKTRYIITIALFGSAWGFLEATLGGVIHAARVPFGGTIMASIGFVILYAALRGGLRPVHLAVVSLVAASFKFFDCWLFGLPAIDMHIVNPATAIACQGLAAAVIFRRLTMKDRVASLVPRFFAAAAASLVVFNIVSLGIYGWPTEHSLHPWNTVLIQLPLMTVLSTALAKIICTTERHLKFSMGPAWRATTTAAFAILAVVARMHA